MPGNTVTVQNIGTLQWCISVSPTFFNFGVGKTGFVKVLIHNLRTYTCSLFQWQTACIARFNLSLYVLDIIGAYNVYAQLFSWARVLIFGYGLLLLPYCVYASVEGSVGLCKCVDSSEFSLLSDKYQLLFRKPNG